MARVRYLVVGFLFLHYFACLEVPTSCGFRIVFYSFILSVIVGVKLHRIAPAWPWFVIYWEEWCPEAKGTCSITSSACLKTTRRRWNRRLDDSWPFMIFLDYKIFDHESRVCVNYPALFFFNIRNWNILWAESQISGRWTNKRTCNWKEESGCPIEQNVTKVFIHFFCSFFK